MSRDRLVRLTLTDDEHESAERLATHHGLTVADAIRMLLARGVRELCGEDDGAPPVSAERRAASAARGRGRGVAYLLAEVRRDSRVGLALRELRLASDRGEQIRIEGAHAHLDALLFASSSGAQRRYSRVEATIASRALPWRVGGAASADWLPTSSGDT